MDSGERHRSSRAGKGTPCLARQEAGEEVGASNPGMSSKKLIDKIGEKWAAGASHSSPLIGPTGGRANAWNLPKTHRREASLCHGEVGLCRMIPGLNPV